MKKNCLFIALVIIMCMTSAASHAQTYAYRLVKVVSQYGEVRDITNDASKVYVTFKNNKSTFYISKRDGSRAGVPDASTGYASGFNNRIGSTMLDPQDFEYSNSQGNLRIYKNSRPLRHPQAGSFSMSFNPRTDTYISDYVTDYAKFNADYSRINVVPSSEKGMYGQIPFGHSIKLYGGEITTYVYEMVKEPNANSQEFY